MRVLPLLPAVPLALLGVIGFKAMPSPTVQAAGANPPAAVEQSHFPTNFLATFGRAIFRFDTFGDEQLWTDTLRMHEVDQRTLSIRRPRSRSWPQGRFAGAACRPSSGRVQNGQHRSHQPGDHRRPAQARTRSSA